MLRLSIRDDEAVLLCMTVADAGFVMPGSTVKACDECDAPIWVHDRPPIRMIDPKGSGFVRIPVTAPPITYRLCLPCAEAHGAKLPKRP